jgi:ferredoxin--NADP+ reductase
MTAIVATSAGSALLGSLQAEAGPATTPGAAAKTTRQTVLWSRWWTPALLSIRVTRDPAFRFTPGHYARLGIEYPEGPTVFRPLSVASGPEDFQLEFFCSLIPGGEFSTRLARLRVGDAVEVEKASFGFLTVDSLAPGNDLWLLASGTGLAPFLSMLRAPGVWEAFEHLVVVHSVRRAAELAYADELRRLAESPPSAAARSRLHYLPVVTREAGASPLSERIPALLASGRLADAVGIDLDAARSRVMACGNPEMTRELRAWLSERGFRTTRRGVRGQVAFEKYW